MCESVLVLVAAYNCIRCGELIRVNQQGSRFLVAPTSCPNGCCPKKFRLNMVQSDFCSADMKEYYGEEQK